jgi:hypothetical protein
MISSRLICSLSLGVFMTCLSLSSFASSPYVKHAKIAGNNQQHGKFSIDYVQLVERNGRPLTAADKKINRDLKKMAVDSLCDRGSEGPMTSEVEMTTAVTFVSDRLLALKISGQYSCVGAAHPDGGNSSAVYDRKIGQRIDIITERAPYSDQASTKNEESVRSFILAEMVKQAQIEKAKRGDNECDDRYDPNTLSFGSDDLFVTPKAIIVQSAEAHVSMACQFETTIPMIQFTSLALPGSLLSQLAYGAGQIK